LPKFVNILGSLLLINGDNSYSQTTVSSATQDIPYILWNINFITLL